jgi:hypothetical protein
LNRNRPTFLQQLGEHRSDVIALLLALAGFIASAIVTQRVFEAIPHIEDEVAYVWQAKALAEGHFKVSSPPDTHSFMVPFIVDLNGERFGKYPPGWPAVLALAIELGMRAWINPLLAGLGVWLTYRLGKRVFNPLVGLLAAGLTVPSPFFLMNSGSLLSHPFGLVLSELFALGWLTAFWNSGTPLDGEKTPSSPRKLWGYSILSTLPLGILILTRPMTALAVAIPFGIHGVYLMVRSDRTTRLRLITFGLVSRAFIGLYFLWQYLLTGNALLNPYTLWWPYDKVGFGPGHGRDPSGHTLHMAWVNTRHSIFAGEYDLFGWGAYSWVLLPFGLWAARRNLKGLMLAGVAVSTILVYMAYWVGASLYGPRYYYEGLFSLTLISAAGICWLAGWPLRKDAPIHVHKDWRKLRPMLIVLIVGVLVGINLTLYLPSRLGSMVGLYGIERADQLPFETASTQALAPALVIVHVQRWMEYGALIDLENPELTSPFIFAWSINPTVNAQMSRAFPDRTTYHYYPDQPFHLYKQPQDFP